jgi:sugar lactone lactonase YvrE
MEVVRFALIFAVLTPFAAAQEATADRDRVFASYGYLKTLAGVGDDDDKNFWKGSFEGALGREVELSNPHMTMADTAGNFYIADKESHSVLRLDREGRIHTHAGTHVAGLNGEEGRATEIQLDNPNGLFVRPDGVVYILDFFNQRIRRVDREGQLTTLLHDPSGFGPGRGLWVSPDEQLIYFNGPNQVKRWTPNGGVEVVVSYLTDPGNLTVDPNGALVVTSRAGDGSTGTSHRVYRVGADGELTVIAGNGTTNEPTTDGVPATSVGLESARSVAFLSSGGFFVATQKGGDVWYVDVDGLIWRFVSGAPRGNVRNGDGQRFSTPGDKIAEPRAVALAPNGDLIITTNDNGYIRVVERFQTPEVNVVSRESLHLRVTAGREHRVETSVDLKTWSTWQALEPGITEATLSDLPSGRPFLRVAW